MISNKVSYGLSGSKGAGSVGPAALRRGVTHIRTVLEISERPACAIVKADREITRELRLSRITFREVLRSGETSFEYEWSEPIPGWVSQTPIVSMFLSATTAGAT